jgi:DNA-entry nuclease
MRRRKRKVTKKIGKFKIKLSPFTWFIIILFCTYLGIVYKEEIDNLLTRLVNITSPKMVSYDINEIPDYTDKDYVYINGNEPFFKEEEKTTREFETYSNLDILGRCGVAYANISIHTMPTEERGSIGMVKPSGWKLTKYDIVDGKYLYNRCHLIGYQLAGENANEKNLITCTRYMNTKPMLEFENKVASYVEKTHNHVLYRVTPMYDGNNLVAKGVLMEGYSVEDKGKGIKFNVFVYNQQPGVVIDYKNGNSHLK